MKKKFYLFLSSLTLITSLSSCGNNLKVPSLKKNEDTVLLTKIKNTPEKNKPSISVYKTLGILKEAKSYQKQEKLILSTNNSIFTYEEKIEKTEIKNNDEYFSSIATYEDDALIPFVHDAYLLNDTIIYKDDTDEIKAADIRPYKEVYGTLPDKLLTSFIINQESILTTALVNKKDNQYTYLIMLDKEKAGLNFLKSFKYYAELNTSPTFDENIEFYLTINEKYEPIKYSFKTNIKINEGKLKDSIVKIKSEANFTNLNKELSNEIYQIYKDNLNKTKEEVKSSKNVSTTDFGKDLYLSLINNTNLITGLTYKGNVISSNNSKTPFSISFKINPYYLINFNKDTFLKALSLTIKVNFEIQLSIYLEKGILYLNYRNIKSKINLIEDNNKKKQNNSKNELEEKLNILDYIEIKKDTNDESVYIIKPNQLIYNLINSSLKQLGITSIIDIKSLTASLKIKIENYNISIIDFNFTFLDYSIDVIGDVLKENYVVPSLTDYEEGINISIEKSVKDTVFANFLKDNLSFKLLINQTNDSKYNIEFCLVISLNDEIKNKLKENENKTELIESLINSNKIIIELKDNNIKIKILDSLNNDITPLL